MFCSPVRLKITVPLNNSTYLCSDGRVCAPWTGRGHGDSEGWDSMEKALLGVVGFVCFIQTASASEAPGGRREVRARYLVSSGPGREWSPAKCPGARGRK